MTKETILPSGYAKIVANELNVSTNLVYQVRAGNRRNTDVELELIRLSQEETRKREYIQAFQNKHRY